jgi:hypothetical protein
MKKSYQTPEIVIVALKNANSICANSHGVSSVSNNADIDSSVQGGSGTYRSNGFVNALWGD